VTVPTSEGAEKPHAITGGGHAYRNAAINHIVLNVSDIGGISPFRDRVP
jgi:hypothetical protein